MEERMDSHEKSTTIARECLQPVGTIVRCIDDRDLRPLTGMDEYVVGLSDFNGPQFLGGSLGVAALVAESMVQTHPDQQLDFETVYAEVARLHEMAGLRLGVHMDDHHGEMTDDGVREALEQLARESLGRASAVPGCGFAGLLANPDNPLGLSPAVSAFFVAHPNMVDEMIRRGARLSILAGDHAQQQAAYAVENMDPQATVHQSVAIAAGAQTYNHDTARLEQVLAPLGDASDGLLETNARWLRITTNILAGMDPDQLDPAY